MECNLKNKRQCNRIWDCSQKYRLFRHQLINADTNRSTTADPAWETHRERGGRAKRLKEFTTRAFVSTYVQSIIARTHPRPCWKAQSELQVALAHTATARLRGGTCCGRRGGAACWGAAPLGAIPARRRNALLGGRPSLSGAVRKGAGRGGRRAGCEGTPRGCCGLGRRTDSAWCFFSLWNKIRVEVAALNRKRSAGSGVEMENKPQKRADGAVCLPCAAVPIRWGRGRLCCRSAARDAGHAAGSVLLWNLVRLAQANPQPFS